MDSTESHRRAVEIERAAYAALPLDERIALGQGGTSEVTWTDEDGHLRTEAQHVAAIPVEVLGIPEGALDLLDEINAAVTPADLFDGLVA